MTDGATAPQLQAPSHRAGSPSWRWAFPALIAAATVGVYLNSLSAPFIFDDIYRIADNPRIRQCWPLATVCAGSTRPLLQISLALNYQISGSAVWSYHVFNVLVHVAGALTLFGVLRRTLLLDSIPKRYRRAGPLLALAAALLWAVHPLQTQSVNYVIQRAESLAALFLLLTLYSVIRLVETSRRRWFTAALACCALGMGCKETMVAAPLLVLLFDRGFVSGSFAEALRRRWVLYAGLAATWLIPILLWQLNVSPEVRSAYLDQDRASALSYALSQPAVILHYLRLSVWPHPLVLDYGWPVAATARAIVLPSLGVAALVLLTLWACRQHPRIGFLGAWFFLILAPTSSILPLADLAFEHRMYLPLAAVIITMLLVAFELLQRILPGGDSRRRTAAALLGLAVLTCAALTVRRNHDYRDEQRMWRDVIAKRPQNPRGPNNLGEALVRAGKLDLALPCFRQALQIKPTYPAAHANLGNALAQSGDLAAALPHYQKAITLKPDFVRAYHNLGVALAQHGRLPESVEAYRQAIQFDPDFADAHYNLGVALTGLGRAAEAVAHFEQALQARPRWADAHYNLGNALLQQRHYDQAQWQYKQAILIDPGYAEAYNNVGSTLLSLNQPAEAQRWFIKAARIRPEYAEAYNNLGAILMQQGSLEDAASQFRKAIEIEPQYADAHYNLANTLAGLGAEEPALAAYRKTVEIRPDHADAFYQIGTILFGRNQPADAEVAFGKTLQLRPNHAACHNNLGTLLAQQGRLQEAADHYRKASKADPNFAEPLNNLCGLLKLEGRLTEAEFRCRQALQINPDYIDARFNLANILVEQQQLEEAVEHYRRTVQLSPDHANAHYNLGVVLAHQGQLDEAIAHYQHALKIQPDHADAKRNLQQAQTKK